ncbi:MAG: RluA family pseudouridine synthase [Saprospiraceae bacterium]|jgi:23S rRNA pseudouridine1911/1915/1917 synthase|nr:RluA family pseudouridine synthase [Saprospiraceae bacterium]MBP6568191.1 RluA family pseudouridine synthase [Saprospiraceae bacterium]
MKFKSPEILFEDEYMIAVNKPAGILTIPDRFNADIPNLVKGLKQKYPDLIPVHRLDKFTSGVILFAKDAETHKLLSASFESREIEKYYIAIVDGVPSPESGRIEVPLSESTVTRGKMLVHKRGKASLTDYKILKSFKIFSLLYIRIHTGRMHQIRVHMQYLGNPLIVDPLYGNREAFFLSEIKHKKFNIGKSDEERPLLSRQPLHAEKLVIHHPYTSVKIVITAEIPKDMEATIHQMEKWIK